MNDNNDTTDADGSHYASKARAFLAETTGYWDATVRRERERTEDSS